MLNRIKDYSRLAMRLFFNNRIVNCIVLVILLVLSIVTITVMNIFMSYNDIGKRIIEDAYNDHDKVMEFSRETGYFSKSNIDILSERAAEWGYDYKMIGDNFVRIDDVYYDVSYFNEYINDYSVTEGTPVKDNSRNLEYIYICNALNDKYSIGDKITLRFEADREETFIVAGYCDNDELIIHSDHLQTRSIYFYDDFDSVKSYKEIIKLNNFVTSDSLIKELGIDKEAQSEQVTVEEIVGGFYILPTNMIEYFVLIRWAVLAVLAILLAIILGISGGVIRNYYSIHKEKNYPTLRMYSSLGVKDRELAYMFIMPLAVFMVALSLVALGISALLCLLIQPVILDFIFSISSGMLVPQGSLYMISPYPVMINCLVMLLFITVSFLINFKTVFSRKKSFLSEVR